MMFPFVQNSRSPLFRVLIATLIAISIGDVNAALWVRGTIEGLGTSVKNWYATFHLDAIRGDDQRLTGLAVLTRHPSKDTPTHFAVTVVGVETADGRFWPLLSAEVSDDLKEGWRAIAMSAPAGKRATRRVEPQTPGETFFVDLSTFQPLVGKARYGRIVLPDGEAALFCLENLQVPQDQSLRKKNKSKNCAWYRGPDELHPLFTDRPFLERREDKRYRALWIEAISCEKEEIRGEFVYGALGAKMSGNIEEEALSKYRNFWPTVSAQVANDERGEWKTIGESSKPDKLYKPKGPPKVAQVLHVDLSLFRRFIGKFRYGRVVLTTGESAVFELRDLLPPEEAADG